MEIQVLLYNIHMPGSDLFDILRNLYKPDEYHPEIKEKKILSLIHGFPDIILNAAEGLSPSIIANYAYELAKEFNQYYQETAILKAGDEGIVRFRILLAGITATVIKKSMYLLGVEVPEKM